MMLCITNLDRSLYLTCEWRGALYLTCEWRGAMINHIVSNSCDANSCWCQLSRLIAPRSLTYIDPMALTF